MKTIPNMYKIFGGNTYYPIGGMCDLLGESDTLPKVTAKFNFGKYRIESSFKIDGFSLCPDAALDWFQIVDANTWEIVDSNSMRIESVLSLQNSCPHSGKTNFVDGEGYCSNCGKHIPIV